MTTTRGPSGAGFKPTSPPESVANSGPSGVEQAPELPRSHSVDAPVEVSSGWFRKAGRKVSDNRAASAILVGAALAPAVIMSAPTLAEAQEVPTSDAHENELRSKLTAYVESHFAGDYEKAFDAFDKNDDNNLSKGETGSALKKIRVGNFLTRGAWVDGIFERFDSNSNGKLTWNELTRIFR